MNGYELERLPVRAQVAFAARCARRILHLLRKNSLLWLFRRSDPHGPLIFAEMVAAVVDDSSHELVSARRACLDAEAILNDNKNAGYISSPAAKSLAAAVLTAVYLDGRLTVDFNLNSLFFAIGRLQPTNYDNRCKIQPAFSRLAAEQAMISLSAYHARSNVQASVHNTVAEYAAMMGDFEALKIAAKNERWTYWTCVQPKFFTPIRTQQNKKELISTVTDSHGPPSWTAPWRAGG